MRMRESAGEPNSTDIRTLALPFPQHSFSWPQMREDLIKTSEPQSLCIECLALNKQDGPCGLHQQRHLFYPVLNTVTIYSPVL